MSIFKKNMRKLISMILCIALVGISTKGSFAAIDGKTTDDVCPAGWTDLGNGVWASDEMTFEETVDYYAKDMGISVEDARQKLQKSWSGDRASTLAAQAKTSRILSISLNVTSSYKPKIKLLVHTSDWNNYWIIDEIYEMYLSRAYNGISKQYSGKVKVWYRGNNKVEYLVVGDFYNNGSTTTTQTASGSYGIGDLAQVAYQASQSTTTNHYAYYEYHNFVKFNGNGNT